MGGAVVVTVVAGVILIGVVVFAYNLGAGHERMRANRQIRALRLRLEAARKAAAGKIEEWL